MNLVIVESPTKAKKLGQFLGKSYAVEASRGHVRDLPKSTLGVDVENNFEPEYATIRGSAETIKKLKTLAKKADVIYLASDPDREGEAIAWHVLQSWEDKELQKKAKRAVFHEITKHAVTEAIAHPKKINIDLVDAQQARRVLDRLVGYKLSPLLWKKVRRGLSAGRVQSVALRMIVEREIEIEQFVPEEYWEVDLTTTTSQGDELIARVIQVNGEEYKPTKEEHVTAVHDWAPKATYTIQSVEKKQRKRKSLAPFTTSTLQQQASTRLGMSAKRTMQLAQQLYEEGLITYHRTDSTNLSEQSLEMARSYITETFGKDFLPAGANRFAAKSKNAQEAHEAIRPTEPKPGIEENGKITSAHARLYDLIFRRFIASQMNEAVSDLTTIVVHGENGAKNLLARLSGSIIKHAGWTALFPQGDDVILPAVEKNAPLTYKDWQAEQKFTQPPPRYNDASLVKELEKRGIGRPSTYASIISVIEDRGYVERQNKAFMATAVGRTVIDFLKTNFAAVVDYDFTAKLENDLDAIALGEKEWQLVMKDFFGPFSEKLAAVEETAERMPVPVEPLNKTCPECGVPEADFEKLVEQKKTLSGMTGTSTDLRQAMREATHGELVIRTGRFGKFVACCRYPECKYTEPFLQKIDMVCPKCNEGDVVLKRSKKGRPFYGCSRYPDCDFASWNKPKPENEEKNSEQTQEG